MCVLGGGVLAANVDLYLTRSTLDFVVSRVQFRVFFLG